MSVEYYYMNDLNTLYNASVGDKTDGGEHHMKMMVAHDNLEAYMQKMEHWRDTALQLSRNNGEAQAKINALEADYVISNRELLVKQVEIDRLTAELALTEKKLCNITDGLLDQATVSIGAVIACCTYNSNAEAMAGAYGISYRAFTMIDNFIKNYNRAVLDGKASTDVKYYLLASQPAGGAGMRFGSLFSGVGGFDLGFERAGMECAWQVEFDKNCQNVLKKHWSETELFDDVRTVGKHSLKPVDVICGGIPLPGRFHCRKKGGSCWRAVWIMERVCTHY